MKLAPLAALLILFVQTGFTQLDCTHLAKQAPALLRHANVTTTQIYTHVDEDETRSAVENLN